MITEHLGLGSGDGLASPHRPTAPSIVGLKQVLNTISRKIAKGGDSTLPSRDTAAVIERLLARAQALLDHNRSDRLREVLCGGDWHGTLWAVIDMEACGTSTDHKWTAAGWVDVERRPFNPSIVHLCEHQAQEEDGSQEGSERSSSSWNSTATPRKSLAKSMPAWRRSKLTCPRWSPQTYALMSPAT